jgi:hypothetical protein
MHADTLKKNNFSKGEFDFFIVISSSSPSLFFHPIKPFKHYDSYRELLLLSTSDPLNKFYSLFCMGIKKKLKKKSIKNENCLHSKSSIAHTGSSSSTGSNKIIQDGAPREEGGGKIGI